MTHGIHSLDIACRAALVVVFVLAAASKLSSRRAFDDFVHALAGFGFPVPLASARTAAVVILGELAAVASLIAWPPAGYLIAAVLLAGFAAGIVAVLARGATVHCRCFGASDTPIGAAHLARNGFLLAVAAAGEGARVLELGGSPPDALVVAALAGMLAGLLAARLDDLLFLLRRD